jgi:myo-inositol-1(or 4)-monophosphatase
MNNKDLDKMESFIKNITVKAGKETLRLFGKIGVKYIKTSKIDVVTEADLRSEHIIVSGIKKRFPDHGIISEESPDFNIDKDYLWIIDPLDGTRNYSRHTPEYGVMVALCYKKEVIMSTIYLPYFKELYFARKGKGAYLNNVKIRCASTKEYKFSFGITVSIWRKHNKKLMNLLVDAAGDDSVWISSFGAAAMIHCMIASGKRDWTIIQNHKIWDVAAGYLLMKESGCKITQLNGKPWNIKDSDMVAASPALYKELLPLTKKL